MLGGNVGEVYWAVMSAVAVAATLGLILWCRKSAKVLFFDWFAEAVDTLVEPKLFAVAENSTAQAQSIKDENAASAVLIKAEAVAAADRVRAEMQQARDELREDLRIHTDAEAELVAAVVRSELAPMKAVLDERTPIFAKLDTSLLETTATLGRHIEHDERVMEAARDALAAGQGELRDLLAEQHDANQARFRAIEKKVGIKGRKA